MVGSLTAIIDKDPEEAHEVLASALGVMTEAVHAYGGVVAERQGDGIMAIFGAPVALEDHATRACLAALRLHALVAQTLSPRIEVRVGINSGEVAVGPSLSDFASDYTATGAVVHIAARLQATAPPNSTVMTSQTEALVRDAMLTERLGRTGLKGLKAPIETYRLVRSIGAGHAAPSRSGGPFVGRVAPLALLDEALAEALEGRGCVFAIVGEAGIGKTALIEQFVDRHRHVVNVTRGTVAHYTTVAPFQPFAEIMRQLLGLSELGRADQRARLDQRIVALGLDREMHEAALSDLLDLTDLPESWGSIAPLRRHDLIGSTVIDVLLAECHRQRLVIVLEDLQQVDSATLELIKQLAKPILGHPLLVVVAFRPELTQGWQIDENHRRLNLDRLTDEDTRKLLAALLGGPALPGVEKQLVAWSKGNPLFLRESVRAMLAAGAVGDTDAAARTGVPLSISAIIAARIDRLTPGAKRILLAASVLGKQFSLDVLAALSESAEEVLLAHLDVLAAAGFFRRSEPTAARRYAFEHGLFQEVGYATLLRARRKALHRAAFTALRGSSHGGTLAVEELAYHAFGGELWTEAVPLCHQAGHRAAERYSNREAAHHFENAVAALAHCDQQPDRLGDAISLRLALRAVSIPLLRLDRVGTLLAEAHDLAQRLGNRPQSVRITAFRAGHAYLTRDAIRCVRLGRTALELASHEPDMALRVAPTLYMAQANYGLGRYRRVIALLNRDLPFKDGTLSGAAVGLPLRPLLMRGYWLAIAQAELGAFEAAEALAGEMLGLADERQPFEALYALTAQGFILMLHGEFEAALRSSASALATADHLDIALLIPVLASQVGFLLASQGHVAEGLALARRAVRKAEEIGTAGRSRWRARLGEVCLMADAKTEAGRHADAAVRLAEEGDERGYLCSALRLRAKAKVADADLEGAAVDLLRATSVARSAQIGPALAKCHFDTGMLKCCAGLPDEARESLSASRSMFAHCHMRHGVVRTVNALSRLDVRASLPAYGEFFGSAE